jgi:hypothetical protein
MPTYTFFTEREGGTYIAQFRQPGLRAAWGAFVEYENARSGIPIRKDYDDDPVAVETVQCVWCRATSDQEGNFILVHIVKTDTSGLEKGVILEFGRAPA